MKKTKIYVVPHTHWDKEWYFTKRESDVLLINNIKKLITVNANCSDFPGYVYDGQASIVDDYLSYYPEDESKIKELIAGKKLIVGPWYTQPDFFNTSSESIVRNLLVGINKAKSWGHSMNIAYVPDSFGHSAQLPQIYRQFDLDGFIYWRGVKEADLDYSTLHFWQGIDGTKIKAYNFLLGYWIAGSFFPYETIETANIDVAAKKFLEKFKDVKQKLIDYNRQSGNKILLPLGGDQAPIINNIGEFIKALDRNDKECAWICSDYDDYFAAEKTNNQLHVIAGELKWPNRARIHKTIGSQRYDIKQLAKQNESNLYHRLEPLSVMWSLLGGDYPDRTINRALLNMLECHAHDSLGGCNTDATNAAVYNRARETEALIGSETGRILRSIAADIAFENNDIIVFNTLGYDLRNYVRKIKVFTKFSDFVLTSKVDGRKLRAEVVSQKYLHDGMSVIPDVASKDEQLAGYYISELLVELPFLAAFSFTTLRIEQSKTSSRLASSNQMVFENDIWRVTYKNVSGAFDLIYKPLNKSLTDQFSLIADYDAGDSYDYSPPQTGCQVLSDLVASSCATQANGSWAIFTVHNIYEITDGVRQAVDVVLTVDESEQLRCTVDLDNHNQNIRWRMVNDTKLASDFSYANQAYCEVARPVVLPENLIWSKEKWDERPIEIETNESYVYLRDKTIKIGFITKGCNEYQIINEKHSTIALTLFRSVDYLGKHNLVYRPGRASGTADYLIKTNDACLHKLLHFEIGYFVVPVNVDLMVQADLFNTDLCYYQKQDLNKYLWRFERFIIPNKFCLNNEMLKDCSHQFILNKEQGLTVKALKRSESGKGYVLRYYNNSGMPLTASCFVQGYGVASANLLEQTDQTSDLTVKVCQIKTVMFHQK